MRTGIETRAHLESNRKRALRLEKADQAGVRSRLGRYNEQRGDRFWQPQKPRLFVGIPGVVRNDGIWCD
jgi:hypothetical protein